MDGGLQRGCFGGCVSVEPATSRGLGLNRADGTFQTRGMRNSLCSRGSECSSWTGTNTEIRLAKRVTLDMTGSMQSGLAVTSRYRESQAYCFCKEEVLKPAKGDCSGQPDL